MIRLEQPDNFHMKLATYCLWSLFITASTALEENLLLSNFFLNSTAVSALRIKETDMLKRNNSVKRQVNRRKATSKITYLT